MGLLDRWLAPVTAAGFRSDHLGRRALFGAGGDDVLATLADRRGWRIEDLLAGRTADVTAWFGAADGRHLTAKVSPEAGRKLYEGGTTLYLLDVPGLDPLAAEIAGSLRVPPSRVTCGVFANQPGARTPVHFDPVDTITVQVRGSKRWRIAPNRDVVDPTRGWAALDRTMAPELWQYAHDPLPPGPSADVEEHVVTAGSVLYVPRAWWHETTSDEESVSLHVHHLPLAWADAVVDVLQARLSRHAHWRAGALSMWDAERRPATEDEARRLLDDLRAVVGQLTPEDLLPPVPGAGAAAPARTPVIRRAGAGIAVTGTGAGGEHHVVVSVGEHGHERRSVIAVPASAAPALRRLAAGAGPLTAPELAAASPGLTAEEAGTLVATLLDAGFLRRAA